MVTTAILTLLAIQQAVFGHPVDVDASYDLNNGLSPVGVSCLSPSALPLCSFFWPLPIQTVTETTQTIKVYSIDARMPPEGLFEGHSTSSAPHTTTAAALLDTVGAPTKTPAALRIPTGVIILAVVIPLVALAVLLVAYKTIIACRRASSLTTATTIPPMPLIASIRVVAVTEVPAKIEQDKAMKSVRDFWSPISPGPPELHVDYKNLEVAVGTTVDPATTRLPLLTRDASGFFYDSDHLPATTSTGITEYALKGPPPVDRDASSAAPETEPVDEIAHHKPISAVSVIDDRELCSRPSTPKSVRRTVCTLKSISSSPKLRSLETATEAAHYPRPVLRTVNRVPVIRIIKATPEQSEKGDGYTQQFNSRTITPRQERIQDPI